MVYNVFYYSIIVNIVCFTINIILHFFTNNKEILMALFKNYKTIKLKYINDLRIIFG